MLSSIDMTFDERLIESVRKYPVLFDTRDQFYHDFAKRDIVWMEISHKLRKPVEECKRRWASLRDNYRKAMAKKKRRGDQGSSYQKKWKFEEEMSFIKLFSNPKQKSFLRDISGEYDESEISECASKFEDKTVHEPSFINLTPTRDLSPVLSSDDGPLTSKKEFVCSSSGCAFIAKEYEKINREKQILEERNNDQLAKFFAAIEETVRGLPIDMQVDIKAEIFLIVSKYEKKNVERQTSKPNF